MKCSARETKVRSTMNHLGSSLLDFCMLDEGFRPISVKKGVVYGVKVRVRS